MERLTEAELATMRAEHVPIDGRYCWKCSDEHNVLFPCDAARLLAQFAPGPVAHLAGIEYGLMGPTSTEELLGRLGISEVCPGPARPWVVEKGI